jgi:hypothetical protein
MGPKIAASMRPAANPTMPMVRCSSTLRATTTAAAGSPEDDVADIPESENRNEQLGVDGESIEI